MVEFVKDAWPLLGLGTAMVIGSGSSRKVRKSKTFWFLIGLFLLLETVFSAIIAGSLDKISWELIFCSLATLACLATLAFRVTE
jgi:hypothetical protein